MNGELLKLRDLLRREYDYERETFRRETRTMGVGRKVKRGMCWFPVQLGRGYYSSLNQYVVELTRTEDLEIEHLFEYGKPVCFFYDDGTGQIHYLPAIGQVSYVDGDRMVVALPGQDTVLSLQDKERLGVQLYFDEQTYRLMFEALDEVIGAKTGRLAELRDMFHGTVPVRRQQLAPVGLPWLNATQERAVNEILCAKDVAVVHGPPGTGKTTTLVEAIYEVLRRENQVLVCAQSNMAVDWISEQLVDRNISVLRIGNPSRVNDKMLSFTYERSFAAHPDYPELWAVRRTIRQLYATSKTKRSDNFHQKISRLKDRAAEIELRIRESLFQGARVIASTLAGAGNPLLYGRHYHTLFIDEAAQALEPACWIAIRKADRVVLAGDHQQLPPTVKCVEAERQGLSKTLMETIVENKPKAVTLLDTQYRMTEPLMHFSSEWFYGGKIKCAPNVKYRSILDLEKPITWVDTSGMEAPERFVGDTYGRVNDVEAQLTVTTLLNLIEKTGAQRLLEEGCDFGIISPYKAQVQQLWRLIRKERHLRPFRQLITVGTVDGFQGQERDVIIISMVRSNDDAQIGFLTDLRRMNVAMTRARMKLVIIGNATTLTRHRFYKALYDYVEKL
jgi:ATP-dependent RNA/DNA helicase IGHMBP2